MLPGKVLFFFGRPGFGWGFGISVSWTVWEISRETIAQPFSTCRISFSKLPGGVNGRSVFFWWEIHLVSSFGLGRNAKW